MKNVLKSKRKETFLAKDIENKYYEHIEDINEFIGYYDQNGNITELRESYSDGYHCSSMFKNGNIVKECSNIQGVCHQKFEYEYDEQGYLKPYAFDYWWEGTCLGKKTLEIESDNYGNRIERYSEPQFGGDSNTFIYKNGNLIEEHYRQIDKLFDCYNTYDDKDRIIAEEFRLFQLESYLETKIVITQYFYDESDNIIQEKKAVGTLDEKFFNEEISKDEFYTGEYTIKEFIREDDKLLKTILYNCEVDEVDDFLYKDEFKKSSIIEVTEYVREEEEHETTPYMEDKNGPFILKIEQEIANDFLQSKLIEIYDKISEMLLKSIKISGYNSTEYEDGIVKVEETIYEYY